jgi:hypothetical protein
MTWPAFPTPPTGDKTLVRRAAGLRTTIKVPVG